MQQSDANSLPQRFVDLILLMGDANLLCQKAIPYNLNVFDQSIKTRLKSYLIELVTDLNLLQEYYDLGLPINDSGDARLILIKMNSVILDQIDSLSVGQEITCLNKLEALGNEVGRRYAGLFISQSLHYPDDFILDYLHSAN